MTPITSPIRELYFDACDGEDTPHCKLLEDWTRVRNIKNFISLIRFSDMLWNLWKEGGFSSYLAVDVNKISACVSAEYPYYPRAADHTY